MKKMQQNEAYFQEIYTATLIKKLLKVSTEGSEDIEKIMDICLKPYQKTEFSLSIVAPFLINSRQWRFPANIAPYMAPSESSQLKMGADDAEM